MSSEPADRFCTDVFAPLNLQVWRDPYRAYAAMRERAPVAFDPAANMWFVTSYDHCRAVLRDARFSASEGQLLRHRRNPLPTSMLNTDALEHARLRRAVAPAFEPRALARSRGWVQEIVRGRVRPLLGALESGTDVDIVTEFARPIAVAVLGRFLGLPDDELAEFGEWSQAVAINLDPFANPDGDERASRHMHEMLSRFADQLHARSARPRDDALTVVAESHASGLISAGEALSTIGLLVIGGVEPMSDAIANSAAALLGARSERPHDRCSIRSAVDELLRFDSPIQFTARRATEDLVLGARRIAAGDKMVVLLGAANRDPDRFTNPDRIVLSRRVNPHLSFGFGVHVCLGAPLVRLVAELICAALPRPMPTLVAGRAPAVRSSAVVPRGYHSLPVRQLADHP
jgi:cytochrome P450